MNTECWNAAVATRQGNFNFYDRHVGEYVCVVQAHYVHISRDSHNVGLAWRKSADSLYFSLRDMPARLPTASILFTADRWLLLWT